MSLRKPLTYESLTAVHEINSRLGLPDFGHAWELALSDSARIGEFCDLYENGDLDDEAKFALMKLIVASLDDYLRQDPKLLDSELSFRVERLLKKDFELHFCTIHRWSQRGDSDSENTHAIAPFMQRVWEACFAPEHDDWLKLVANEMVHPAS